MRIENQQLKAFILDSDMVPEDVLNQAEKKAIQENKKLSQTLLDENLIKEDELIKLQAYILGIPFVNLERHEIPKEILNFIPEPIARTHNIVAFKKDGSILEVAMLDPEDLQTINFIAKKTSLTIKPRLTSREGIRSCLKQYQKSLQAEFGEIIEKNTERLTDTSKSKSSEDKTDLIKVAEDLPIIKIVDTLLKHAIIQGASDIHIEPLEKEVIARYRIDGILHDAMTLPRQVYTGIVARIKVLSNLKLDEHRLPQDGRFKIETSDYRVSFRVSLLPVFDGEKIVMRLLDESSKGYTLENLGFWGEALEILHRNIKKPNGMILVTGPTGSGKTTTLYTILDILNQPEVNISTVEDPVEYRMPRVNQTQVNPKIGLTFAAGLRSLLRQDPDVIMVGEIRDEETAEIAVHAALTGHLVLSTLHTNSAAGTLPRILDMGIEPYLIASTANVIVAQRLVRKVCSSCAKKYKLDKEILKNLKDRFNIDKILEVLKRDKVIDKNLDWTDIEFTKGEGCEHCNKDGYRGRIGIYEVLEVTEDLGALIATKATSDDIENLARKKNMVFMIEDGFAKAIRGITTVEEILRVTKE